jgi:hypothetical protein
LIKSIGRQEFPNVRPGSQFKLGDEFRDRDPMVRCNVPEDAPQSSQFDRPMVGDDLVVFPADLRRDSQVRAVLAGHNITKLPEQGG